MAHLSTRAVRMQGVRKKILDTAKKLFSQQGYKKTTIRQIVQESGITSGSIYNLFENKDAVFSAIIDDLMAVTIGLVEKNFSEEPPLYKYAAIMAIEWFAIEKDEVLRELYYEAFADPILFEAIVNRHMALREKFLEQQVGLMPLKQKESHARMILTKGAMLSYIESFAFHQPVVDSSIIRRELTLMTFSGLGVRKKDLKDILNFINNAEEKCTAMASELLAIEE